MNSAGGERFSVLGPIEVGLQKQIAKNILEFFDPGGAHLLRAQMRLPGQATPDPFSVEQFFAWSRMRAFEPSYDRLRQHVFQIIRGMLQVGLLSYAGRNRSGSLEESSLYVKAAELSAGASQGSLFLGRVLGPGFIAHELRQALVAITGMTKEGDAATGTGLHVHHEFLVTCEHVIDDMTVSDQLTVNGSDVTVIDCLVDSSKGIDVGVVRFAPKVPVALPDLLFRDASLLEEVVVAGFPSVPTTLGGFASFQRGEICQVNVPTLWKNSVDLFSAIARPGNSGGPLVTLGGNVVGLVTQSLEREREHADRLSVLPFFAAVPASDVRHMFEHLTGLCCRGRRTNRLLRWDRTPRRRGTSHVRYFH